MFRIFFLLFLLVPLAEIYLLIQVGSVIGAGPTVLLVIGTAALGAGLLRWQGLQTLGRARHSLDHGALPAIELMEGVVLLISGALLLTPGFVTDALGFACLIRPVRIWLVRRVLMDQAQVYADRHTRIDVIEGEYHRDDR